MENVFTQSLWGDEGFSAILSMKPLPEIIKIISRDTSPPLWNIWEWLFFRLFGTEEVIIRSLSLIFFLGAVFFTFKIGQLLWDNRAGFLAAVMTFLNPFFFTYAFEGRMYSILALGVTASMYFFLKILNTNGEKLKTGDKVGYVVATLWAMYSHHFAILAIFLQGLWFLYEFLFGKRKTSTALFKLFIVVGIGYLPWLYPLYTQTQMVSGGFWLGTPTAKDFWGLLEKYLGAGIVHPWSQIALYLTLFLAAFRKWSLNKKDLFLLSWFLVPITLTWIVSQFFQSIFFDRYLLYTIPGAMILMGSRGRKISAVILVVLVFILINIDVFYFTHPTKRPFRQLANYVKQTQKEGDFLINWNAGSHHLWETKYYDIFAPIYIPSGGELPFFVGTALMENSDIIQEIPENTSRVGVITSGSIDDVSLPGYTEIEIQSYHSASNAEIHFLWLQKDKKQ